MRLRRPAAPAGPGQPAPPIPPRHRRHRRRGPGRPGDHVRLELRARDVPDLDLWAAKRNGDLFELEFSRRVVPVAVEVT